MNALTPVSSSTSLVAARHNLRREVAPVSALAVLDLVARRLDQRPVATAALIGNGLTLADRLVPAEHEAAFADAAYRRAARGVTAATLSLVI